MNRKFILASGSPRRKELLALIVPEYEVFPADIDETLPEGLAAEESAEFLALQKAAHVSEKFPESIVIGCDTVVISEGEVLGKPADISDAERMLKKLSGKIPLLREFAFPAGNIGSIFRAKRLWNFIRFRKARSRITFQRASLWIKREGTAYRARGVYL